MRVFLLFMVIAADLMASEIILSPLKSTAPRKHPWIEAPGQYEQSFPLFLAAKPKDLAFGQGYDQKTLFLPANLEELGSKQFSALLQVLDQDHKLVHNKVEFLIWPAIDSDGQFNWVFAQWRMDRSHPWKWLDISQVSEKEKKYKQTRMRRSALESLNPIMPQKYHPFKNADDYEAIFADFLEFSGPGALYQKASFGDCVWVEKETLKVVDAWLQPGFSRTDRELKKAKLVAEDVVPYCVAQPPFAGAEQIAFVFSNDWNFENSRGYKIQWFQNPPETLKPLVHELQIPKVNWSTKYLDEFRKDVRIFSGEIPVEFEKNGRKHEVSFKIKGSFEPRNDLEAMVDYLENRYASLNVKTYRQRFNWRGIKQSNLIALIKGQNSGPNEPKVVAIDHIDTAVAEDIFEKTGKRVTVEGASDNVTATATLLRAAEVLKNFTPKYDILLVHLTGEEFPSDGLGAWHFLSEAFQDKGTPVSKIKIKAVIVADFIGFHHPEENKFQINPTFSGESLQIARLALDAADKMIPKRGKSPIWEMVYRPRHHPSSGVFNTDLMEFEYMGIPGLLFNEYLDYSSDNLRKMDPHNHQSHDVPQNIDYSYASEISKVIIETIVRAANFL